MVLQDLGDTPQEGFGDNPYPSDNDPYSNSSLPSPASGHRYDANQLPQPIPILGPFIGFSSSVLSFKTNGTIDFAEKKIGRQLTYQEAHALAYHCYRMEQTKSYFTAAGLAVGTWRWYTTMAVNRYPMYLPKPESVNPNRFMFITGPLAQPFRHGWRFLLYGIVAGEVGKMIGSIYAQPKAAQDTSRDPQLGEFAKDLKKALQGNSVQGRAQGMNQEGTTTQKGQQQGGTQTLPPHAGQPRWGRRPPPQPQPQSQAPVVDDDDMSPTAGNDPWSSSTTTDSFGDSGFSADRANTQPTQDPVQPSAPTNAYDRRPARRNDYDASPTGGLSKDDSQNQPNSGESAWERLRRGANRPIPQGSFNREKQEGSTNADGFTFAESDDDRKRAQEQAQREFDRRLERERQGKNFNDERRW